MGFFWLVLTLVAVVVSYLLKRSLMSAGRSDTSRPVKIVSMSAPGGARQASGSGAAPPRARAKGFQEDLTFGDPTARRLRSALVGGDWSSTHAELEACRDWGDRAFLVEALAEHEVFAGREALFEGWQKARPGSGLPWLLRGRWRIAAAWKARGSGQAASVTQEGWKQFFRLLSEAESDLQAAAAREPDDPTPWAALLVTARGLQKSREEEQAVFDEVRQRDPAHFGACRSMLRARCAKWGGSHQAMFAFARESAAAAPEGSLLGALVPLAHAERYLWATGFADKAADDPEWFGKGDRYFRDPAVQRDLVQAWERSFGSPSFREVKSAPEGWNAFAFAFHLAGDQARARVALERTDKKITATPWTWLGKDPLAAVQAARAACGLPAL